MEHRGDNTEGTDPVGALRTVGIAAVTDGGKRAGARAELAPQLVDEHGKPVVGGVGFDPPQVGEDRVAVEDGSGAGRQKAQERDLPVAQRFGGTPGGQTPEHHFLVSVAH